MFLKQVSYAHHGWIYLIKNIKNSNIVIFFLSFLFEYILNVIYSYDDKADFQHHYSSLQCHMILQKPF